MRALLLCHLFPHDKRPSYGIFIYRMAERLVREGIDLDVIVPVAMAPRFIRRFERWATKAAPEDVHELPGAWVRAVPYFRPPGAWFRWFEGRSVLSAIHRVVESRHRERPYEVIHCNMLVPDGEAALSLSRRLGVPCVTTTMGQDINIFPHVSRILRKRIRRLLCQTDQLIAVSEEMRAEMEKLAHPCRPIEVIYRGCDTGLFRPLEDRGAVRRGLGWEEDDLVCVFMGQLADTKGVPELLEAVCELRGEFPGLRLILIGASRMERRYRDFVAEHGLEDRVTLTGYVEPNEVPGYLGACDVFAFPSHTEGMPNALVEAMSCEAACVATRAGGIPELLEDGRNGLLVEIQRTDQLTAGMRTLLGNSSLRAELGRAARRTVLERFDADRNVGVLAKLLRSRAQSKLSSAATVAGPARESETS